MTYFLVFQRHPKSGFLEGVKGPIVMSQEEIKAKSRAWKRQCLIVELKPVTV